MGKQVAVLVHGAALYRDVVPELGDRPVEARPTVDLEQFGAPQATRHENVEHAAPGFRALSPMLFDESRTFWPGQFHCEPVAHHASIGVSETAEAPVAIG